MVALRASHYGTFDSSEKQQQKDCRISGLDLFLSRFDSARALLLPSLADFKYVHRRGEGEESAKTWGEGGVKPGSSNKHVSITFFLSSHLLATNEI